MKRPLHWLDCDLLKTKPDTGAPYCGRTDSKGGVYVCPFVGRTHRPGSKYCRFYKFKPKEKV